MLIYLPNIVCIFSCGENLALRKVLRDVLLLVTMAFRSSMASLRLEMDQEVAKQHLLSPLGRWLNPKQVVVLGVGLGMHSLHLCACGPLAQSFGVRFRRWGW